MIINVPFEIKYMYPRVAQSAKLKGVTGSAVKRNSLAAKMNRQFSKEVDNIFKAKAKSGQAEVITKSEIQALLKKICTDVYIKVQKFTDPKYFGRIAPKYTNGDSTIWGYDLLLNFKLLNGVNVLEKSLKTKLLHESRHLFDVVTQPKSSARMNTLCLLKKLKKYDYATDIKHSTFYDDNLYPRVNNAFKIATDREFYKNELLKMRSAIDAHFEKLKTGSEEKIQILQRWRHDLKAELNARDDEVILQEKSIFKQLFIKADINAARLNYLYLEKIRIVENILDNEISKVRNLKYKSKH